MYLFVQTLVNMSTRESMQLQPKVTKCKSKERVVFLKDDTNLHNVLLQLQVLYLTIIIFSIIITLTISAALQVNFSKISSAILLNIGTSCSFSTVQNVFSNSMPLTALTAR